MKSFIKIFVMLSPAIIVKYFCYIGFIFLGIQTYSCRLGSNNCKAEIDTLTMQLKESEFNDIYGFSAEATWRLDNKGKRKIHRIMYANDKKERFHILGYKNPSELYLELDTLDVCKGFATELGFQESSGADLIEAYKAKITNLINKYDIKGIHSQNHLGQFIEFELRSGCSVWYKRDGAKLNLWYNQAFSKAYKVRPNWYILRIKDNEKLIDLYQMQSIF